MSLHTRTLVDRLGEARTWAPGQGWGRLLGAVRDGLRTSGAAAVAHDQHATAQALRSRQIRPRRISVIGSNGGVGTTTVAAVLASVLSAVRDDQTLVLTMHSDATDVAVRLSVPHAPSVTQVLAGLCRQGQIPPTPVTRTGLRVLSAPPPGTAAVDSGLVALLDAAASGHASVVVDAGVASRVGDLTAVAQCCDTVVLVTRTTCEAISAARASMARWRAQLPPESAARLILLLMSARTATERPGNDPVEGLRADGFTTYVMAPDPELGRGLPIDLSRISGPSLTAVLELAADIMGHR